MPLHLRTGSRQGCPSPLPSVPQRGLTTVRYVLWSRKTRRRSVTVGAVETGR